MITILRLGHRCGRDERISTHVGLVARALGADSIVYSGEHDEHIYETIKNVTERFGGPFAVSYEKNWRKIINEFKGAKIHLTMYGIPFESKIEEIKNIKSDLLIIVGGEKVPMEVYHAVDYNIAIGNQPHSEVAALAIFMNELKIKKDFSGKIKVIPQEKGKRVEEI